MRLEFAGGSIESDGCLVMGIMNRTPDSFYDGGRMRLEDAVEHAHRLINEGADLLDVGTVRAGPGAAVGRDEELRRLIPLVEAVSGRIPVSVETSSSEVATASLHAGAAIINDVSGLRDQGLARVCAESGAGLVLMHNGGQIRGRPRNPRYVDVVEEVLRCWDVLVTKAESAGVRREQIIVDPGLDFGKNTFQSLELMRRLPELVQAGRPVLVAASRKDIVGETLALAPPDRLEGSLALASLAVAGGAAIVRVHDVKASVRAVRMVEAVMGRRRPRVPVRGLWE
jgi:dihydropteroate synthase